MFIISAVLVTTSQFFGEPIQCETVSGLVRLIFNSVQCTYYALQESGASTPPFCNTEYFSTRFCYWFRSAFIFVGCHEICVNYLSFSYAQLDFRPKMCEKPKYVCEKIKEMFVRTNKRITNQFLFLFIDAMFVSQNRYVNLSLSGNSYHELKLHICLIHDYLLLLLKSWRYKENRLTTSYLTLTHTHTVPAQAPPHMWFVTRRY